MVLGSALAEDKVLNIYSARHYQTDEALYARIHQKTGIKINRIEGKEEELLERIKNEAATVRRTCSSPSTLAPRAGARTRTVRAGQVARAGSTHSGSSAHGRLVRLLNRARVIVYRRTRSTPMMFAITLTWRSRAQRPKSARAPARTLQPVVDGVDHCQPGRGAGRSLGERRCREFARSPKGGDTDQIKAVAARQVQRDDLNTYYLARLMRSARPRPNRRRQDRRRLARSGGQGTHQCFRRRHAQARAPHKEPQ